MSADVLVVGAGVVGLAVAWRARAAGLEVRLVDEAPGRGASHVAAGMLAPVTEAAYGEEDLVALHLAAADRWPSFAAELDAASGIDVGYRPDGTLVVGFDTDDVVALDHLHGFQRELGLASERLRARACREREPLLHPRVRGGLWVAGDHRVEPRRVVAALLAACRAAGVEVRPGRVRRLEVDGDRAVGATLAGGERVTAGRVVLAAGAWAAAVDGLPAAVAVPVRPVKGQLLVLRARPGDPRPRATVRALVRGRSLYLVPRGDDELVVGATQEERGFDPVVTAGAVRTLLDDAAALLPGVDELELVEALAGLRPGTPDNRPLVGPTAVEGLVLATGHHRHGVLLAPTTADAVAALLVGEPAGPLVEVADPRRPALARAAPARPREVMT